MSDNYGGGGGGGGGGKKPQKPKKMSYRDRQAISYQQGADPPFLAQMKKQLGYREYTVEDKFKNDEEGKEEDGDDELELDRDDIRNMTEEERPQIVVLDPERDISSAQLQKEVEKKREEDEKKKIMEGRITFRKPEKRPNTEKEEEKGKEEEKKPRKSEQKEGGEQQQQQPMQNKRLLSFGGDDEE